ncbi:MAG: CHASE2 domain-containing protein [Desulfamplus sp.]|nr:CHASE2 domain-containing protein [Desulfamplus sp.]
MITLRNKKQMKAIGVVSTILLLGILTVFFVVMNAKVSIFNIFDFKALDIFYKLAVKQQAGPKASFTPKIVYLNITDETYNFFDKNYLDRKDMATLNNVLSQLDTQAVIYDIIFARRSSATSDLAFSESLETLGNVYLPTALVLSEKKYAFRWKTDPAHERFRADYLGNPNEKPASEKTRRPFNAVKALMQQNDFAIRARGSGDINAKADIDGIYRHITMLAKVDDQYFPTLSLSVFLDWAGISLNDITVEWGEKITIPASEGSFLDNDVIIPIDRHGRTFIPFVQAMGKDFSYMSVHTLISNFQDEDLRGNLLETFEGNFVFVGDIAIGTSDLGYTPLQKDSPLVITHASLLNALLTNTFYKQWPLIKTLILLCLLLTIMACASLLRSSWVLYVTGSIIIMAVPFFTWTEFISFQLFPVVTVTSLLLLIFFSFIATLETSGSKERAFIRDTFARYVPEKVVSTLLAQPEMVTLGGEERIITVLFSDIANFTTISESLTPTKLVNLLNEYFTEMSNIIMENGGIIDKFQGDSVMAEFGVPIPFKDHADKAVTASLQMIDRLSELREIWRERNKETSAKQDSSINKNITIKQNITGEQNITKKEKAPEDQNIKKKQQWYELYCRIGINTNNMIVGNIGSKSVLDYTVIGDAVNLASRLEGANKLYETSLMISEFTHAQLTPGRFKTRILDYIKVKGKNEPVFVYEVYGENKSDFDRKHITKEAITGEVLTQKDLTQKDLAGKDITGKNLIQKNIAGKDITGKNLIQKNIAGEDLTEKNIKQKDIADAYYIAYHQGFEAYLAQNFTQAIHLFHNALKIRPSDAASIRMLERIDKIDLSLHPDSNWDGSVSLTTK